MIHFKKALYLLATLGLVACNNEAELFPEEQENDANTVSVTMADFVPEEGSRTTYDISSSGVNITWAAGDVLGVFPGTGKQTAFNISSGAGSQTAVFDGQDWRLRPEAQYAAYFPLQHDFDLDKSHIVVDYSSQAQSGDNTVAHLGQYDFMYAPFITTNDNGNCDFQMQHLGALARFQLTMPLADTYSSFKLTTSAGEFTTTAYFGLSAGASSLTKLTGSSSISLGLSNIATDAGDQVITLYTMMAPGDYSSATWTLEVTGALGKYVQTMPGKNVGSGKIFSIDKAATPEEPFAICFTATTAGAKVSLAKQGTPVAIPFEYSTDGTTWATYTPGTSAMVTLANVGDKVYFRRGDNGGTALGGNASYYKFTTTSGKVSVKGNIMSLLSKDASVTTLPVNAFNKLFSSAKFIDNASQLLLPATTLAKYCYQNMFSTCTGLTAVPALPATSLTDYCYSSMFSGCSKLTSAPALAATALAPNCYSSMFENCTSLTAAPALAATTLAANCYDAMFSGCSKITVAPTLAATTLAKSCYSCMFMDCTNLVAAPDLPAVTLVDNCYYGMFYGCSKLSSIKISATTNATEATDFWLGEVAATGTFKCKASALGGTSGSETFLGKDRGDDGIPAGWTVVTF